MSEQARCRRCDKPARNPIHHYARRDIEGAHAFVRPVSPEAAPPRATTPEPRQNVMDAMMDSLIAREVAGTVGLAQEGDGKVERGHPESMCQRCGGRNVVWFAPNDLWNRAMHDEGGILCPTCFIIAAEAAGIVEVWRVAPESRASSPSRESGALLDAYKFALIALIALMRDVDADVDAVRIARAAVDARLSALERDAARMREALEFYSNNESWQKDGVYGGHSAISYDHGRRARAALAPSGEPRSITFYGVDQRGRKSPNHPDNNPKEST